MQIQAAITDKASPAGSGTERADAQPVASGASGFGRAWAEALAVSKNDTSVIVKRGDTLVGLTRQYLAQQHQGKLPDAQVYRMALNLASQNGIANPDLIYSGQSVNLSSLNNTGISTMAALQLRQPVVESIKLDTATITTATPVLDKTLARAVAKNYLSDNDMTQVREKILTLSERHHFSPDDFATLTLMESDGMNPRASNGSCHGIIQFCDGSNRGAASAGFGSNPQAILSQSVLQQLDLVDHYFKETRLKQYGPASLDDLYLTVLTPAARQERRADVPLPIAGRQSAYLYEGRNPEGVITRNSLLAGLRQNARHRLGSLTDAVAMGNP